VAGQAQAVPSDTLGKEDGAVAALRIGCAHPPAPRNEPPFVQETTRARRRTVFVRGVGARAMLIVLNPAVGGKRRRRGVDLGARRAP
jgi:hypothetical protein